MKLRARMGGILLAGDEVRIAVVKTGGKVPALQEAHAARAVYNDPEGRSEAIVLAIRDVVSKVKNKPALYVLCESAQYAITRTLNVPFKGRSKVSSAVPFELEQYIAFPLEQLVVDHATVMESGNATEVLAVALRRTRLDEQLALLQAAGVEAESIGLDAAGLTTLWMAGRKTFAGLHAALHVQDTGGVLVVTFNKTIAYLRPVQWTPETFFANAESAGREVQNSLRAFQSQWKGEGSVEDITLTGVEPGPAECTEFERCIQIPVIYENLIRHVKGGSIVEEAVQSPGYESAGEASAGSAQSRWAAVIGVAAGSAGGACTFEFRKGDLAPEGTGRMIGAHAVFSAALFAVVALGFGLYCYLDYRQNAKELDRIGTKAWETFAETFPASQYVAGGRPSSDVGGSIVLQMMEEETNKALGEGELLAVDVLSQPTLLDMLQEIAKSLPPDRILVTDVAVRAVGGKGQTITIKGQVLDQAASAHVLEPFKDSELLAADGAPLIAQKGDKTEFTILAVTKPKG
ncbi:MAG: hypothetical protein AMXMBFR84_02230 [Candidatus Hydrogenedentota bacterium]